MESLLRLVSAMGYTAHTWEAASSVAAAKSVFAILFEGESTDEDSSGIADTLHVSGRFDRASTVGDVLSAIRALYEEKLRERTPSLDELARELPACFGDTNLPSEAAVQKVLTLWTVAGVKLRGQAFGETILTFPNSDQLELMRILETENALSASISTPASALDARDRDLHDQSSSDLKHQLQALQHELSVVEAENRSLQEQLRVAQVSTKLSSPSTPTAADNVAHSNLRLLESQVDQLNSLLAEREEFVTSLQAKLNKSAESERMLAETNRAQADELDVLRPRAAAATRLESQLSTLKKRIAENQDRIKELEDRESVLANANAELEGEKAGTASLRTQLQELRGQIQDLEAQNAAQALKLTSQTHEISRLQQEQAAWLAKRVELESQLIESEQQKTMHADDVPHLTDEIAEWKRKYEDVRKQLEDAKSEESKRIVAAVDDASSRAELESAYKKIKVLEEVLEAKTREHAEMSSKISGLEHIREAIKTLESDKSRLNAKLDQERQRAGGYSDEIAGLREQMHRNETQHRGELSQFRASESEHRQKEASLSAALEEVQKRCKQLETDLKARGGAVATTPRSAGREDAYIATALYEFGRDIQRNLLRGSLYAGTVLFQPPSPSDSILTAGPTTAIAGAKSFMSRMQEEKKTKVLYSS